MRLWQGEGTAAESREAESAVDQGPAAEGQSWLGPYPVTKALPTFENLTFRKLRDTVQADLSSIVWIDLSVKCMHSCFTLVDVWR